MSFKEAEKTTRKMCRDASAKSGKAEDIPQQATTFLGKLLAMVEDPKCQTLIFWSPRGKSFIVTDPTAFAKDVLPKYFKHSNFSSFVRQLNMYDFHKVLHSGGAGEKSKPSVAGRYEWEFANDYFQRGRADLMDKVRRKAHTVSTDNHGGITKGTKGESIKRVLSQIETLSERNREINEKMEVIESDSKIIWGEMSRLKTRHDLQQQTINRVLYFLTSVYAPERIEKAPQQYSLTMPDQMGNTGGRASVSGMQLDASLPYNLAAPEPLAASQIKQGSGSDYGGAYINQPPLGAIPSNPIFY